MRVELRTVTKRFGAVAALDRVTLDLASGSRVALIGPNASGKTTLTRALLGLLEHEGEVRLDGAPPATARAGLVYVPQVAPQMAATVGELCRAVTAIRRIPAARVAIEARALSLDLAVLGGRPFRSLSGGTKQKLLLALAFAAEASLYLFDEPTASLDAAARARFYQRFAERSAGATLVLSSHRLEEIRHLVDHVVALEDGRVVYDGTASAYLVGRARSLIELELGPAGEEWARANGFVPGAAGWWTRVVTHEDKLRLLPRAMQGLNGCLRNVSVRDLEQVEVDRATD